MDRVEDVLLHQKILADAEDPEKRPIFYVRFMKCIRTSAYGNDGQQQAVDSTDKESSDRVHERIVAPNLSSEEMETKAWTLNHAQSLKI